MTQLTHRLPALPAALVVGRGAGAALERLPLALLLLVLIGLVLITGGGPPLP